METLSELFVFVLTWCGIMALIGIICYAVSRWGKKQKNIKKDENESLDK